LTGFETASVTTSAFVRPTHQLECRLDSPPSLGLFVISFFFERASFFGSTGAPNPTMPDPGERPKLMVGRVY
jgi:hypothetical protein